MIRILKPVLFLAFVGFFLSASSASAQINRDRVFLRFMGGLTYYGGDTDGNPSRSIKKYWDDRGGMFKAEVGYRLARQWEAGFDVQWGKYLEIEPQEEIFAQANATDDTRISMNLMARYNLNPRSRAHMYFQTGLSFLFGHYYNPDNNFEPDFRFGSGVNLGLGISYQLNQKSAVFFEFSQATIFPDDASDSADYGRDLGYTGTANRQGDANSFDSLGRYGFGVRYNLADYAVLECVPTQIVTLNGPVRIVANKDATFIAAVEQGSLPVEYVWDFGDGTTANGKVIDHQFPQAGTYIVTFSAIHCGGTETASMTVNVVEEVVGCDGVYITEITARPDSQSPRNIIFNTKVEGTSPITYRWDFGDGKTSNVSNPRHLYERTGSYTVTLEVENCSDLVRQAINVFVYEEYLPPDPCSVMPDLEPVNFDFGSARLDDEGRQTLIDNLRKIRQCNQTCVQIAGYTDNLESNNFSLSEQRANVVRRFYTSNGIGGSKVSSTGYGKAPIPCLNEDPERGCRRNRRAESFAYKCR